MGEAGGSAEEGSDRSTLEFASLSPDLFDAAPSQS
jgi:hypothetical protein